VSEGEDRYARERGRIEQGHLRYRDKLKAEGKLFVRERLTLLLDPGSEFQEDWLFARAEEADTPADGVVTGVGTVGGRPVCVMAKTTPQGRLRARRPQRSGIQKRRLACKSPWCISSTPPGADLEQIKPFRRWPRGRIFHNEVQLSGVVPQVCVLFGPSPAGSAYLPALTDLVIMVEGKASLYVGSPRMVEMAVGEKTTLEELGGARMLVSGCGDNPARREGERLAATTRTCPRRSAPGRRTVISGRPSPVRPSRRMSPTTSESTSTCTR
jgi:acetyl-CoA carboxylase carboxyltransferase component